MELILKKYSKGVSPKEDVSPREKCHRKPTFQIYESVSSSCYDKTPQKKWLYKEQKWVFQFQRLALGMRTESLLHRYPCSCNVTQSQVGWKTPLGCFQTDRSHLQRPPPYNIITLVVRISVCDLGIHNQPVYDKWQ